MPKPSGPATVGVRRCSRTRFNKYEIFHHELLIHKCVHSNYVGVASFDWTRQLLSRTKPSRKHEERKDLAKGDDLMGFNTSTVGLYTEHRQLVAMVATRLKYTNSRNTDCSYCHHHKQMSIYINNLYNAVGLLFPILQGCRHNDWNCPVASLLWQNHRSSFRVANQTWTNENREVRLCDIGSSGPTSQHCHTLHDGETGILKRQ